MAFWIREATLVIGNKKYTLGELDFKFSIPFDDSDEPPVATVTVTNLSANTRANIKKMVQHKIVDVLGCNGKA